MTLRQHAYPHTCFARTSRVILLALGFAVGSLFLLAGNARAQGSLGSGSRRIRRKPRRTMIRVRPRWRLAAARILRTIAAPPHNAIATSSNLDAPVASLPADQIIRILQQNEILLMDVKSQVADRLQQQGTQIEATDITDEMLYNQIATNASVRANVTTYLRARGYVPQGGLQSAGAGPAQNDSQFGLPSSDGQSTSPSGMSAGGDHGVL